MSVPEDYERGYHGHGRGLVVTQPRAGEFEERPMTAGELAARAPAWAIGGDIYKFTEPAVFAYIRCWEIIAPVIEAALTAQAAGFDRRATELLAANTAEVERRRNAEHDAELMRQAAGLWSGAYHEAEAARKALSEELRRIHDREPDGHRKPGPRPLGLVSSEPVTGD